MYLSDYLSLLGILWRQYEEQLRNEVALIYSPGILCIVHKYVLCIILFTLQTVHTVRVPTIVHIVRTSMFYVRTIL